MFVLGISGQFKLNRWGCAQDVPLLFEAELCYTVCMKSPISWFFVGRVEVWQTNAVEIYGYSRQGYGAFTPGK